MTPIKAAAEPSELLALADKLGQLKNNIDVSSDVPTPFSGSDAEDALMECVEDNWGAIITALRLAAVPAGNDSDVLAEIWRLCDSASHLSKREIVGQIAALVEANTRAKPAGNDGVRRYVVRKENSDNLSGMTAWGECWSVIDAPDGPDAVTAKWVGFFIDQTSAETVAAALSPPQPRETFADEIKRAAAAPPEASFDNASDMLGYLNAPREAEPVAWQSDDDLAQEIHRVAGCQVGSDRCKNIIKWFRGKQPASPSPIPEAPVPLDNDIGILLCVLHNFEEAVGETIDDTEGVVAQIERDYELRALKPQDGGNCEHGITKVNCGICVPSEVFSGRSGR